MTPKQLEAITRHGNQLNAIFHTGLDPVTPCKKLRRIEGAAHKLAEDACNYLSMESEEFENRYHVIKARLFAVLEIDCPNNRLATHVKINLDPRGYALKLNDDFTAALRENRNIKIYTDWGGFGILAPEFGKDGK